MALWCYTVLDSAGQTTPSLLMYVFLLQYLKCSPEPNFSPKQGGAEFFFSQPVAGLTNRGHLRDFGPVLPCCQQKIFTGGRTLSLKIQNIFHSLPNLLDSI